MKIQLTKRFLLFIVAMCAGFTLLPLRQLSAQTSPISSDHDIRPLLTMRCLSCHNENKQSGRLRLDAKSYVLRGGQSDEAIMTGNASASLLYQRITAPDGEKMPPSGARLDGAQIALIKAWIEAVSTGEETVEATSRGSNATNERQKHWAWQSIQRPAIPVCQKPKAC